MNVLKLNDYELIYLIREGNEKALELMYLKYKFFIISKLKTCYFEHYEIDDCLQEGYLILDKALKSYNEEFNKTFTKYFELLLIRRIINVKRKKKFYEVDYDLDLLISDYDKLDGFSEILEFLDDSEERKIIFEKYYLRKSSIKIAKELSLPVHRFNLKLKEIRNKLKVNLEKYKN